MQKKHDGTDIKPKSKSEDTNAKPQPGASRIVGNGSEPGNKPAPATSHRVLSEDRTRSEDSRMAEEDDPLLDERDLEENRLTGDQDDIEWDPDLGHSRTEL